MVVQNLAEYIQYPLNFKNRIARLHLIFIDCMVLASLGIREIAVLKVQPNLKLLHPPFPQTVQDMLMEITCWFLTSAYCYHQCLLPVF